MKVQSHASIEELRRVLADALMASPVGSRAIAAVEQLLCHEGGVNRAMAFTWDSGKPVGAN
jgi:hypothetical protein